MRNVPVTQFLLSLLVCALALVDFAGAQWVQRGQLTSAKIEGGGEVATLTYLEGAVRLQFYGAGIMRVRYEPDGDFKPRPSYALVSKEWPGAFVTIDPRSAGITYRTDALGYTYDKRGRLQFRHADGSAFLTEDPRGMAGNHDELIRPGTGVVKSWWRMPDDEAYFGFGEKSGPMNRRGRAFTMWNTDAFYYGSGTDPLYQSIPFFMAIKNGKAWGLFLDAPERSSFDMGLTERGTFSFSAHSSALDFYVIAGPHPKDVIRRYTALTGRIPMPPQWALGYQQCRYSYYPERRVREIAADFRKHRIPCDVIWLDIDYMDGYRCFTWDKKLFPNPKKLISDLRKDGFSTVVMIDPGIKAEKGYAVYDQGVTGDHFVKNEGGGLFTGRVWPGQCVFPDFHRQETRDWWATLYREFVQDLGVRGVWNDMNEPSVFDGPGGTMPLSVIHRAWGREVSHDYAHNTYGMQMVRATYEGILRHRPNERVFVLTRASYAGGQRYAAGWTGDNRSYWEHLEQSVPMTLNWGLSGHAFTGPDVGGFTGSPSAELLTRWTQVGALLPLCRNHTSIGTRDQEPWVHGEPYTSANRKAIELRYRLLPYLYSVFRECARTGVPVARLPLLEYPEWTDSLKPYYDNQYFLGANLLVAPVVRIGEVRWGLMLPKGEWYDFNTGKRRTSKGERFKVDAPLDTIPIWVRAGAVIPMQSVVQHTGEKPTGPLVLRAYPGDEKRVFEFYEDDGVSFAFQDGAYRVSHLSVVRDKNDVVVRVEKIEGKWSEREGACRVEVFGVETEPAGVMVGSRTVRDWRYDASQGRVDVEVSVVSEGLEVRVAGRPR